ncbi:MAG: DUF4406 domain-containing protein [Treponema sp.]|nr:DUF4406 domain-containing protein [Treponema sp.]
MGEKLKIYISGKITGDANYRSKFSEAENRLWDGEYIPLNPASIDLELDNWPYAMRRALHLMLRADGVALLPDWKKSREAKIEAALAKSIGMPVHPIAEWMNRKKRRCSGNADALTPRQCARIRNGYC